MEVPKHIAIIMDGNGRWAQQRGLPRTAGHNEGGKRVKEIIRAAKHKGVKILTVFAFSTENWDRPRQEIDFLFKYLEEFLKNYRKELIEEDIKFVVIGRKTKINEKIIKKLAETERLTENNKSFLFVLALDYGGRWDIVDAARRLTRDVASGTLKDEDISEDVFGRYMALSGLPDPDLLVRTSGEERISNFLLWNLAYTELYFSQLHWPDFTPLELDRVIEAYSQRQRRFGKI